METLLELDETLFFLINHDWHTPFLDTIMPHWRAKTSWIPAYIALLGFIIWKFRRQSIPWILFLVLTVAISDTTSSQLIKKTVQRVRPCNDLEIKDTVNILVRCGGGYSFTSSHATNHFAVALFLIVTLGVFYKWIKIPLLLWAASIALGQVYVGVHYPLDIVVGGLIGSLIGFFTGKWFVNSKYSWVIRA